MFKQLKLARQSILLFGTLVVIAACTSTSQQTPTIAITHNTGASAPVCLVWRALSYSARVDSALTVREIIASNAARAAYCSP